MTISVLTPHTEPGLKLRSHSIVVASYQTFLVLCYFFHGLGFMKYLTYTKELPHVFYSYICIIQYLLKSHYLSLETKH